MSRALRGIPSTCDWLEGLARRLAAALGTSAPSSWALPTPNGWPWVLHRSFDDELQPHPQTRVARAAHCGRTKYRMHLAHLAEVAKALRKGLSPNTSKTGLRTSLQKVWLFAGRCASNYDNGAIWDAAYRVTWLGRCTWLMWQRPAGRGCPQTRRSWAEQRLLRQTPRPAARQRGSSPKPPWGSSPG